MSSTYSVTEAQAKLPALIKQAEGGVPVRIRRRGDTVAVLVSMERMEAIAETMEILANPEAMRAIEAYRLGAVKLHPLSALED